ncbi:MAG: sigma-70 family RNA polymerase sigma factor [Planctomycetota bacterium JB042]
MADEETLRDLDGLEHAASLRRLARALLFDPADAQDVVQQAWLAALQRPAESIRAPRAWLAGVVRHLAKRTHRDGARRERRERAAAVPEGGEPAGDAAARIELLRRVLDAVGALDSPYREAILARYVDDVPVKEFAARRGVPEATVRTWLRRGLERLRVRLDDGTAASRRAFAWALAPTAGIGAAEAAAAGIGFTAGAWLMNGKVLSSVAAAAVVVGVGLSLRGDGERARRSPERTSTERTAAAVPAVGAADLRPIDVAAVVPEGTTRVGTATEAAWPVRGRAVTPDGAPVDGVEVRLRLHRGLVSSTTSEFARVTVAATVVSTAGDGRFAWPLERPDGAVTVEVEATGEHHAARRFEYVLAGAPPPAIELEVRPRDGRVTGVVRDEAGGPIGDAVVSSHGVEARADAAGRYAIAVPSDVGTASILVNADGFAGREETFRFPGAGESLPVDVTLVRELRARGVVRDEDGRPVAGARVRSILNAPCVATTGADGRFELGGLDPNHAFHFLEAEAVGHLVESESFRPDDGGRLECALTLERGRRLAGRVLGEEGRPVHGARVSAQETEGHEWFSAATDATGRFELLVASGPLRLLTRSPGHAPDQRGHDGVGPDGAEVEIVLGAGHFVGGRVVDERGVPLAGASVFVRERGASVGSGRADEDGRVRIDGLPAGDLTVTVEAAGHTTLFERPLAPVDVEHHVWTLRRAGGLAGVVLDGRTGRPIPSFRLRLVAPTLRAGEKRLGFLPGGWVQEGFRFEADDGRWDTGTTRFEVGALIGVEAIAPGYAPATVDRVVVTADPAAHPVTHRLFPPVEVRGQVVRAGTGLPVAGATVRRDDGRAVARFYASPDARPVATTDDDGRFVLPVPGGATTLHVTVEGEPAHLHGPFEVAADAPFVDRRIALGPFGRIEGEAPGVAGATIAVSGFHAGALWRTEATTDAGGRFAVEDVPGGERFVAFVVERAGVKFSALTKRVTVVDGETARVVLEATGTAVLTGTVDCDRALPRFVPVSVSPRDPAAGPARAVLAEGGRFRVDRLAAGEHVVSVAADVEGGTFVGEAAVTLREGGAADVEVRLEPTER